MVKYLGRWPPGGSFIRPLPISCQHLTECTPLLLVHLPLTLDKVSTVRYYFNGLVIYKRKFNLSKQFYLYA